MHKKQLNAYNPCCVVMVVGEGGETSKEFSQETTENTDAANVREKGNRFTAVAYSEAMR